MTELLEPLLKSPLLPELVRQAQEVVARESEAREAFQRELTPDMKAEFILGEAILHSPAKARHLDTTLNLAYALKHFLREHSSGRMFVEKCLVSLTRNDFEPDIVWYSEAKAANFTEDQMRFPAPDFVVEVLNESTEERDRGIKFEDYALHGVEEYWIVDSGNRTVEKYQLKAGEQQYHLAEKLSHGSVRSTVIDGFEITLDDLFS